MSGCEKRLTVWVAYGVLDRTLWRCRLEDTIFKLHPNSLACNHPQAISL